MRDLGTVRQGWEEIEKAEARLNARMTPPIASQLRREPHARSTVRRVLRSWGMS